MYFTLLAPPASIEKLVPPSGKTTLIELHEAFTKINSKSLSPISLLWGRAMSKGSEVQVIDLEEPIPSKVASPKEASNVSFLKTFAFL